jgi:hypothetical protein
MLAGWFGPAVMVVIISGLDRDGGNALGAFFNRAVWLSRRIPRLRTAVEQDMSRPRECTAAVVCRLRTRISLPFAVSRRAVPQGRKGLAQGRSDRGRQGADHGRRAGHSCR